jgi:hypothetical protein
VQKWCLDTSWQCLKIFFLRSCGNSDIARGRVVVRSLTSCTCLYKRVQAHARELHKPRCRGFTWVVVLTISICAKSKLRTENLWNNLRTPRWRYSQRQQLAAHCGGYKKECGIRYSKLLATRIVLAAFWTKIVPSKPSFWLQAGKGESALKFRIWGGRVPGWLKNISSQCYTQASKPLKSVFKQCGMSSRHVSHARSLPTLCFLAHFRFGVVDHGPTTIERAIKIFISSSQFHIKWIEK